MPQYVKISSTISPLIGNFLIENTNDQNICPSMLGWLLPALGPSCPLVLSLFFVYKYLPSYLFWGKTNPDTVNKHRGMLMGKHFIGYIFYQLYQIMTQTLYICF